MSGLHPSACGAQQVSALVSCESAVLGALGFKGLGFRAVRVAVGC